MKAAHPAKKHAASRWPDHALIGLFALLLLLPSLDIAFHIDPTSPPSENRLLAAYPQRPDGVTGLKKFQSGWEAYFNDHFGCRRVLVMWHNKLKWSMFHEKNARKVLVGTGGWMFMSEKWMIEHFCGTRSFTEPELNDWQKLLERRRDWLAQRGIKYLFVLAPDKQSIYPEYLPAWLKDLGGQTKVDQFFAHMKAHSTVEVLDLRPALIAAKKSATVYLKTDTHWNQFGTFVACENIVQTLAHQLPGVVPVALDSFDRTNRLAVGGDLVDMRGIRISMAESNAVFFTPKPGLPALETFIPTGEHVRDLAIAKNPHGNGLAMIHTDSFGRGWIHFLSYQFGEADFFWQYHLDGPLIEHRKPVVVVNEMLERFFNVTDPRELFSKDALP
jgi:alginate O-acetyltransferase complex protein AlgJ